MAKTLYVVGLKQERPLPLDEEWFPLFHFVERSRKGPQGLPHPYGPDRFRPRDHFCGRARGVCGNRMATESRSDSGVKARPRILARKAKCYVQL